MEKTTQDRINALEAIMQSATKEINELKNQLDKPTFEVGKWYNIKSKLGFSYLCCITKYTNETLTGYFFDEKNQWYNEDDILNIRNIIESNTATESEVFEALKKEAEKKTNGASAIKVKSFYEDKFYSFDNYHFKFHDNVLQIWDSNGWISFMQEGKWAEIIKDGPIKIGGYELKKIGSTFKIGCKKVNTTDVLNIKNFMEANSFTKVAFDGIETDLETINKILNL